MMRKDDDAGGDGADDGNTIGDGDDDVDVDVVDDDDDEDGDDDEDRPAQDEEGHAECVRQAKHYEQIRKCCGG